MPSLNPVVAQLQGAVKRYGPVVALDAANLEVRRGELLALLGPNGAGKSTAIGLLLGLMRADGGSASLFGLDPQQISARRRIGVMLQDADLPSTLRVGELLRLTASYYPNPRSLVQSAELAGVADLLSRPYARLSGGQQRRVQFALALCGRPELLFLDEPTVGMDIDARRRLWTTIRQLVAEGCAVLLTTHYLEEAEGLADRVCVMARGRVVHEGTVEQLRARVSLKRVSCSTCVSPVQVREWLAVEAASLEGGRLIVMTEQPEDVVRKLLEADPNLAGLEVRRGGLAEAFSALMSEPNDRSTSSLEKAA